MNDQRTPLDVAERALQDSETRLQQVLDNTSALVFAKDSRGRYLFVNREFERITGRRSVDVVGRTDDAVFPSDLAARFRHNDLRVLRERHAIEFEEVADFGDGLRTFLSSKFPLLDADGDAYAVCGMATDITERKQALEALRDSEAQYRAIFNASEDALVLWDSQFRRVDVNPAFERMYGWSRDEVVGKGYAQAAYQADYERTRHDLVRRALAGETARAELEAVRKDGERIRTEMVTVPFRHRGEPHVLAIARDITERKRLEEALSSAALAVSHTEGEALFRELARYLAAILDADAVFIATLDTADTTRMQVRAMHLDGQVAENFSYELAGTPCETVVGRSFRYFPARLGELFPLDTDFRRLGFNCYAGEPLNDAAGRPIGLIAVVSRQPLEDAAFVESVLKIFAVRVVAELDRVAARDALLVSEASYREIFEASEDAIFVHDWDTGAIVDANPQACRAYGYTRDELLQVRIGELSSGVAPYTEAEGLRWIEQAKRDGSAHFEWHRRSRNGSLHWDEVRLKRASIGGRQRILAFSREVTERKARELELRQSEDRLRATVSAALDCIVVMDHHGRVIEFNRAAEVCFGHERTAVLGRRLSEMMIPERYREAHERGMGRHLEAGARPFLGRRMEICALRADGIEFPVELSIGVAQGADGPIFIGYLRDISEIKAAEERRARLEAQLRQAHKMEAIGQLTGGIAHDFNNLLTSIMGYVALAGERDGALADRKMAGYLAQAQRSCERARDLIQQMLMFSRGQRISARTLSLGPLVQDALAAVRPTLPAGVELSCDCADAAPLVRVDPLQIEQVLLNLCLNARDAIDGAGRVQVGVRPLRASGLVCAGCRASVGGEFVELSIEDDGHGMAPAVVERIFEPFYSTKESGKGTGMGLAMVHGIVHEHGGHVVVESAPGRGSRFRVLWPALSPGAEDTPTPPGSTAAVAQRPRPAMVGSVLIVDDETAVGEFMRELLQTWGLQATFVPQAQAALELLSGPTAHFDALITDQAMPRMTGIQLAHALRASRIDVPVILYTGYGEGLARPELQAAGIRAVLGKPVDPAALETALRDVLGAAPVYSSGTT